MGSLRRITPSLGHRLALDVLLLAAALLAPALGGSCSRKAAMTGPAPGVVVITRSEAESPSAFRGAEAAARERPASASGGEVRHAVLPDDAGKSGARKTDGLEAAVASFIADQASDPAVTAVIVDPALPGCAEGFRRAKEARSSGGRPSLLCVAAETRGSSAAGEGELALEASADLIVDIDRAYRAYLIPWAAKKMGARAIIAAYSQAEGDDPAAARERAIMSAASADLGLKYAAMTAPTGTDPVAYVRAMTGAWLRDFGRDTALYCSDRTLARPLVAGAIAGGAMIADAAGCATPSLYADVLGLDLREAKSSPAKERALLEKALAAAGEGGRFGMWDADYGEASVEGLAEFAYRAAGSQAPAGKDAAELLVSALKARAPAPWHAVYDVDPETGVKSANHVLLRQDVYVLGRGYLQSALQAVPPRYLAIASSDK